MNGINRMLREVIGLFIDDGALAISIIVVVAAAAIVAALMLGTLAAGFTLVLGCIGALVVNVLNAARR